MTTTEDQEFFKHLKATLWTSADKRLTTLDASQYKHVMLGIY
jgi:type I restriction enzyme M protein